MSDVPHLAIPGNGATLDERRVDRVRAACASRDGFSDRTHVLEDFEAILAARVLLPTLPSWAHLVADQPCIEICCSSCGEGYQDDEYTPHYESLESARDTLAPLDDDEDLDTDSWTLVDDELLCPACRVARREEA